MSRDEMTYLRDIAQSCRACFLALTEMRQANIFFLRTRISCNGAVEYMFDEKKKSILTIASLALVVIFVVGCSGKLLPEGAKIQINVPDGPPPTSKTKLIALDVVEGRDVFEDFFRTARRVGRCSPTKIENDNSAHEVITISFWGEAIFRVYKDSIDFCILKNQQGEWITTGYGHVEVYDIPEGFPKYKYLRHSVNRVKKWYEKYVPEENRKR